MDHAVRAARAAGPLAAGFYRVVVSEPDGRLSVHDAPDLDAARAHADDAASETEHGVVLSWVFDHTFRIAHVGKHY